MPVMADRSPVLRIITSAARESLKSLGLARRGRSRLWIDDHGWWLGVVEFTPPRTAGSGLHVGAMWLWHDVDHLAFHVDAVRSAPRCSAPRTSSRRWHSNSADKRLRT